MTSLAHIPAAFEVHGFDRLRALADAAPADASPRLTLRPSGDGWSLVTPDGRLVFQGLGTRGRRKCLEFARAHGVLAVFS